MPIELIPVYVTGTATLLTVTERTALTIARIGMFVAMRVDVLVPIGKGLASTILLSHSVNPPAVLAEPRN
jgi:hypothetical protein